MVHVDGEVVNTDNIGLGIVSDLARTVNQEQRSGSTALYHGSRSVMTSWSRDELGRSQAEVLGIAVRVPRIELVMVNGALNRR